MSRQNRILVIVVLSVLAGSVFAKSKSIAGRYKVAWTKDAGCSLKLNQLKSGAFRFVINCNRGAPTYNSGLIQGKISVVRHKAVFLRKAASGICKVSFRFSPARTPAFVVIEQDGTSASCGFGYKVHCDGKYIKLSR